MRQQATEDQVTHAQQRAFHVGARLRSLLDDWEIAPGEPELRERILALAPLGGELDRAVAAVTDVDGLSEVRVPLDLLVRLSTKSRVIGKLSRISIRPDWRCETC